MINGVEIMARRVFYSFHYKPDNWRASQVRKIGAIEGNVPASDNDWETITNGGDAAIKKWIDGQLDGRSCAVILVGSNTANRKWINYEIVKAWDAKKGVVGVCIHNLKDASEKQSVKGQNPFDYINIGDTTKKLSSVVKLYDPPFFDSKLVYDHIKNNLATWIDEAAKIRNDN
jgi:hypothetical protein